VTSVQLTPGPPGGVDAIDDRDHDGRTVRSLADPAVQLRQIGAMSRW
jgi:hypothetical protein